MRYIVFIIGFIFTLFLQDTYAATTLSTVSPRTPGIVPGTQQSVDDTLEMKKRERLQYYNLYKNKGYDVSLLTPNVMDPTKTTDTAFLKIVREVIVQGGELQTRIQYLERLRSQGYVVTDFTQDILMDSVKFWELVRIIESQGKITSEVREVSNISTQTSTGSVRPTQTSTGSVRPTQTSTGAVRPTQTSTGSVRPTQTSTGSIRPTQTSTGSIRPTQTSTGSIRPTQTSTGSIRPTQTGTTIPRQVSTIGSTTQNPVRTPIASTPQIQEEGIINLMKSKIAKLPTATKYARLIRIELVIIDNLAAAKSKKNTTLIRKYTALLGVVQDEINSMKVDDATIVDALFVQ